MNLNLPDFIHHILTRSTKHDYHHDNPIRTLPYIDNTKRLLIYPFRNPFIGSTEIDSKLHSQINSFFKSRHGRLLYSFKWEDTGVVISQSKGFSYGYIGFVSQFNNVAIGAIESFLDGDSERTVSIVCLCEKCVTLNTKYKGRVFYHKAELVLQRSGP